MDPQQEHAQLVARRHFLGRTATGIGTAALATLLNPAVRAATPSAAPYFEPEGNGGVLHALHHRPTAKRVIYLFMSGGPSQLDTFDYKPGLVDMFDKELPDSIRQGQRITTMTSGQARLPVAPSKFSFAQHGEAGTWMSELLPHMGTVADDITLIKSVHTEAINHDPAITYIQTGFQQPGRPSLGAWLSYGLGSTNDDLPTFVGMQSTWTGRKEAQAL
ncbi:MAG: DUF1501 domain-containing protein [Planctomycetales bacterium]|nr:DUF1501 domain-containing protein [Planctomycetales bacterium]